ncbi:MAG: beta-galactosidase [Chthoniobacter sp.]|nr:beta-galactosidase [Chthoniobacter sp.]
MSCSARSVLVSLLLLIYATVHTCAAGLTARVESPKGAPRIVINGQPVRARMFFGGPGSSALPIGPEWKQIDFEFTASTNAETGTMHFRFGHGVGEVFLDKIQVTDLDQKRDLIPLCNFEGGQRDFDRDWTSWPTGAANTVGKIAVEGHAGHGGGGGLHIQLSEPPGGEWPDFHIYHLPTLHVTEGHHYHVQMWAKGVPARSLYVEFYQPGRPFIRLGGPADPFPDQIKMAAEAGVNFVSFPMGLPWPKPGEPANYDGEDSACRTVLVANPHALLIPRIPMNPPEWWEAAHPGEVMQWEDGHRAAAVPASPEYRRDAAERLAALVKHLEEKFGDHMAGYHPVGQNTGEWFYEDTWKQPLNGYAPADLREWQLWLKAHYKNDDALRHAWNDPVVALTTAVVPTAATRHAAPAGIFRDPAKEQALIDWAQFQQEAMADCVRALAHAARQGSAGKKLVLLFYGYLHEFGSVANGPATSGHYALRRVLDCPDIDILCSPISYSDRGLGGSAPSMTAAESVALAGKMWLNEDDTHTYLATGTPPGYRDHVTTLEETNAELTRNVAQEALRNFATWWMDLGCTGWFRDPGMWAQMKKPQALDEAMLQSPTPFHPEIAAVIDAPSMWRVAAGGETVTGPAVSGARAALGRIGAPYGQYLLDDVTAGKVHAKLYVFLNAWSLSAEQRQKLRDATRGSVCVWCYAPGYFDGSHASLDAMQELTGFRLRNLSDVKAWVKPASGQHAGLERPFGVQRSVAPLFAVEGHADEILFTYPDGSTAVAFNKSEGGGASLFAGAPGLTSELVRFAAHRAGVHLYTETDCNVYASGPFVAVHASQDGPLPLHIGQSQPVTDALTGKPVGEGPTLTLPLHRGETRVLKIGP